MGIDLGQLFTAAGRILLLLVLLAGCATAGRTPAADPCCTGAERYPDALIAVLDPVAPVFGRLVGLVRWRPGYLARQPQAQQAILAELRPLDIVLVSNKQRLSGRTIPGLFGHAAIFLGSERQLRSAGLWGAVPAGVRKTIAGGEVFLEADQKGVHLSHPAVTLDTDRVLVLRPVLDGHGRRAEAVKQFLGWHGTRFDFNFDNRTPECVYCTELIHRVLPELRLKEHRVYGRDLIFPDQVARSALDGGHRLKARLYVVGTQSGWRVAPVTSVRSDIDRQWRK